MPLTEIVSCDHPHSPRVPSLGPERPVTHPGLAVWRRCCLDEPSPSESTGQALRQQPILDFSLGAFCQGQFFQPAEKCPETSNKFHLHSVPLSSTHLSNFPMITMRLFNAPDPLISTSGKQTLAAFPSLLRTCSYMPLNVFSVLFLGRSH